MMEATTHRQIVTLQETLPHLSPGGVYISRIFIATTILFRRTLVGFVVSSMRPRSARQPMGSKAPWLRTARFNRPCTRSIPYHLLR